MNNVSLLEMIQLYSCRQWIISSQHFLSSNKRIIVWYNNTAGIYPPITIRKWTRINRLEPIRLISSKLVLRSPNNRSLEISFKNNDKFASRFIFFFQSSNVTIRKILLIFRYFVKKKTDNVWCLNTKILQLLSRKEKTNPCDWLFDLKKKKRINFFVSSYFVILFQRNDRFTNPGINKSWITWKTRIDQSLFYRFPKFPTTSDLRQPGTKEQGTIVVRENRQQNSCCFLVVLTSF